MVTDILEYLYYNRSGMDEDIYRNLSNMIIALQEQPTTDIIDPPRRSARWQAPSSTMTMAELEHALLHLPIVA